jgi:hypothetical protein
MDQSAIREYLRWAGAHIDEDEQRIALKRALIQELKAVGRDTTEEEALLKLSQELQAARTKLQQRLQAELEKHDIE